MRPEHEWFKPEQLTRYYFAIEALVLLPILGVVAVLAYSGVLWEINRWVLYVGGGGLLVAVALVTWWIPAFYRTADYRLTDDEIEYRRGVFFRQKTTVPYNRITNVDVVQGPIQRLVGAGAVGVHTAGYAGQVGAELTIGGVGDAEEIKDQVLAKVRRRPPEATEGDDAAVPTPERRVADPDSAAVLVELRRIRELLERGRRA